MLGPGRSTPSAAQCPERRFLAPLCYHETMNEELTSFHETVTRNNSYEVEDVLKESAYERTELVALVDCNGFRLGPLIRKSIDVSSGLGSAYKLLCDAQNGGQRFLFLPRILSCEQLGNELVVVMEKAPGTSLDQAVLKERSRDGFEESSYAAWAGNVFLRLCDAVNELHSSFNPPLIHRDLKPSNILLSSNGLTIVDFGIARTYRAEAESDTVRFGTCAYAPPEQFGYGQTDVRSDVYALGMVLLFMLTGKTPSAADAGNAALRLNIDSRFAQVAKSATAFDPDSRFESVAELRKAFETAQDLTLADSNNLPLAGAPSPAFPPSSVPDLEAPQAPFREHDPQSLFNGAGADASAGASVNARAGAGTGTGAGASANMSAGAIPGASAYTDTDANASMNANAGESASAGVGMSANAREGADIDEDAGTSVGADTGVGADTRKSKWSLGEKVGFAWDALILGFALMIFCACGVAVFKPTDYDLQFPLWFRLLEYVGFFATGIAGVSFILMDKRPPNRFSSRFRGRSWKSYLPLGLGLMATSALCLILAMMAMAVFFPEVAPSSSF